MKIVRKSRILITNSVGENYWFIMGLFNKCLQKIFEKRLIIYAWKYISKWKF